MSQIPENVEFKKAFRIIISMILQNNESSFSAYDAADIANHVSEVFDALEIEEPGEMCDELGDLYEIAHDEFESIAGYRIGENQDD